jgi:hypothetical protein
VAPVSLFSSGSGKTSPVRFFRRRRRRERPITEEEAYRHSYGHRSGDLHVTKVQPKREAGPKRPRHPVLERGERIRLAFEERMSARTRSDE